MNLNSIAFTTGDSGDYYYHQWLPQEPSQSPKAWVHIMHGMAEHSARYQHLAEFLNQQGYLVSADDHRGHGKTGRDERRTAVSSLRDCCLGPPQHPPLLSLTARCVHDDYNLG